MADEFTLTRDDAGETNYVVLRRVSDAYAWDNTNTVWEAYSDGSWGDYDIPLTDDGGGLYTGNMPGGISAGTRLIIWYFNDSGGGSPATSDTLLLTVDGTWNGTALTSNGSVTLDSRALSTLESAKRALNLVSDVTHDVLITELINMMSDKIEQYLGRRLAAADYMAIYNGDGEPINTRHWPLIRVLWCRFGLTTGLNVDYTGTDVAASVGIEYNEEGSAGQAYLWNIAADGTTTTNAITFASNPTLSTLATAISAVAGWTATKAPSGDAPADSLLPFQGVDAKTQTGQLEYFQDYDLEAGVDNALGQVFMGRGVRQLKYRGGYETIPDDVASLCNDMVQRAFYLTETNTGLTSETIPDYSYSLADGMAMMALDKAKLAGYCNVGVG